MTYYSHMFDLKVKVLVVEDAPSLRMLTIKQLRDIGFENVIEADSGSRAQKVLQESLLSNEPVGLVISDLNMPNGDGMSFLKYVRNQEAFKKIPFMVLTAEADKDKVLDAIKLGVNGYLIKPITEKILKRKLENAWIQYNLLVSDSNVSV